MVNIGIVNPVSGNYMWYHSTPIERADSIRKNGLKINSEPTWQSKPEPWIYVSVVPFFELPDYVTFEVDLSKLPWDKCGWAFDGEEQLRVFEDIPTEWLKEKHTE